MNLPAAWLAELAPGDRLKFSDARGQVRTLDVRESAGGSRIAEAEQTAYLTSDTTLQHFRNGDTKSQCRIATIPPISEPIVLRPGDLLHIEPGVRHNVEAAERARLQLTVLMIDSPGPSHIPEPSLRLA